MANENEDVQGEQDILKSQNSNHVSFVLFRSRIKRPLELLWVNYSGKVQTYSTMNYGDVFYIDTFVTHPWIAWDAETHKRYLLDHKAVYLPPPFDPNNPEQYVTVNVDMPVYSLREVGLQSVRGCLKGTDDGLDQLELPRNLLNDLKSPPGPGFQYAQSATEQ